MPNDRPNGVGPHEFRELELMRAGTKPLAMFFDVIPATIDLPEADFEPLLKSGRAVMRKGFIIRTNAMKPIYDLFTMPLSKRSTGSNAFTLLTRN